MHFSMKSTLKNNYNHTPKQTFNALGVQFNFSASHYINHMKFFLFVKVCQPIDVNVPCLSVCLENNF